MYILKCIIWGGPIVAQRVKNPTSICEDLGLIPALLSELKIQHCRKLKGRLQMPLESGIAVAVM